MKLVLLEAVGETVATLATSGLTWLSAHLKQRKHGLTKKKKRKK